MNFHTMFKGGMITGGSSSVPSSDLNGQGKRKNGIGDDDDSFPILSAGADLSHSFSTHKQDNLTPPSSPQNKREKILTPSPAKTPRHRSCSPKSPRVKYHTKTLRQRSKSPRQVDRRQRSKSPKEHSRSRSSSSRRPQHTSEIPDSFTNEQAPLTPVSSSRPQSERLRRSVTRSKSPRQRPSRSNPASSDDAQPNTPTKSQSERLRRSQTRSNSPKSRPSRSRSNHDSVEDEDQPPKSNSERLRRVKSRSKSPRQHPSRSKSSRNSSEKEQGEPKTPKTRASRSKSPKPGKKEDRERSKSPRQGRKPKKPPLLVSPFEELVVEEQWEDEVSHITMPKAIRDQMDVTGKRLNKDKLKFSDPKPPSNDLYSKRNDDDGDGDDGDDNEIYENGHGNKNHNRTTTRNTASPRSGCLSLTPPIRLASIDAPPLVDVEMEKSSSNLTAEIQWSPPSNEGQGGSSEMVAATPAFPEPTATPKISKEKKRSSSPTKKKKKKAKDADGIIASSTRRRAEASKEAKKKKKKKKTSSSSKRNGLSAFVEESSNIDVPLSPTPTKSRSKRRISIPTKIPFEMSQSTHLTTLTEEVFSSKSPGTTATTATTTRSRSQEEGQKHFNADDSIVDAMLSTTKTKRKLSTSSKMKGLTKRIPKLFGGGSGEKKKKKEKSKKEKKR